MDIILVRGLLNITRGYGAESVMRAYKHFVDLVERQAERFHLDVKNTCTIAPLPYPPKLCWLQGNGPLPDNYVNKYNMIRGINNEIEALNRKSGMKAPNFTTFGLRKVRRGTKEITKHHQ